MRHIIIHKDSSSLRTIHTTLRVTSRDRIERDAVPAEPLTVTLPQDEHWNEKRCGLCREKRDLMSELPKASTVTKIAEFSSSSDNN